MTEQQRNMDYLNSTGDKFVKSLPRQRSEQLRMKLADLNDKWRDINLHAEKRQNQVRKPRPSELRDKIKRLSLVIDLSFRNASDELSLVDRYLVRILSSGFANNYSSLWMVFLEKRSYLSRPVNSHE